MRRHLGTAGTVLLLAGGMAWAQQPPGAGPGMDPRPPMPRRPPMERALHAGPRGRWWNNPEIAQKLGLTSEQQKKIDEVFQQSRLKLIDLNASLQKEEVILEPLVGADQPDESKILPQIDRVAQARAELEKANARMLLGIRRVLTPEQWKKLRAEERLRPGMGPGHRPHHPEMRDGGR